MQAIICLVKYLRGMKNRGIVLHPKGDMYLEVFSGANWCGGRKQDEATDNKATTKSQSVHMTYFAGYILIFQLKLQTLVTLSATEAEYASLNHA